HRLDHVRRIARRARRRPARSRHRRTPTRRERPRHRTPRRVGARMKRRRLVVCVVLVVATGALRHLLAAPADYSVDLSRLPATVGAWHGEEAAPLDTAVVRLLAADSYINRT